MATLDEILTRDIAPEPEPTPELDSADYARRFSLTMQELGLISLQKALEEFTAAADGTTQSMKALDDIKVTFDADDFNIRLTPTVLVASGSPFSFTAITVPS